MVMEQTQVVSPGQFTKYDRGFSLLLHLSPSTEPSLKGPVAFVCVSQSPCAGSSIPRAMAGSVRGGQSRKTLDSCMA